MPAGRAACRGRSRVEVTAMVQDLEALAPPVIICAVFLIGAGLLLRRELAPKRRARAERAAGDQPASERDEGNES